MINRRHLGWAAAAMAAAILAGTAAIAADAKASHRWRIEVSESANSDGTIRFAVTPVGGESKTVEVPIKNGRSREPRRPGHSATLSRAGCPPSTPSRSTTARTFSSRPRTPMPKFTVALLDSSVKSVRIHVETE